LIRYAVSSALFSSFSAFLVFFYNESTTGSVFDFALSLKVISNQRGRMTDRQSKTERKEDASSQTIGRSISRLNLYSIHRTAQNKVSSFQLLLLFQSYLMTKCPYKFSSFVTQKVVYFHSVFPCLTFIFISLLWFRWTSSETNERGFRQVHCYLRQEIINVPLHPRMKSTTKKN
jgi:hypothetical protein